MTSSRMSSAPWRSQTSRIGLEVAGHGGDAAGGGADDGLGHEGRDIAGAEALELGLELVREALDVLRFGLAGALPAVGEAG